MSQKIKTTKRLVALFGYAIAIYLAIMIIVAIAAPAIISTETGKNFLINNVINRKIPAQLKIGKISFGWFGEQVLEEVDLFTTEGALLVHIDQLETQLPLWKILWHQGSVEQLKVKNLNASLDEVFMRFIYKLRNIKELPSLEKASDPVVLSSVNLDFDLGAIQKNYLLQTKGFINYKDEAGSFLLQTEIFPPEQHPDCDYFCRKNIKFIEGRLVNIPEALLRCLLMLLDPKQAANSPLLFIGDKININISDEPDHIHVVLQSSTAKGELSLLFEQGEIKLAKPAKLSIQSPEAKNLQLEIKEFILPLEQKPLKINTSLTSDLIKIGEFDVKDLRGALASTEKGFFFDCKALIDYIGFDPHILEFWGKSAAVNLTSSLIRDKDNQMQMPDFKLVVSNGQEQLELLGNIKTQLKKVLSYAAVFHTTLQPETLERWGLDYKAHNLQREPLDVRIAFNPSIVPLTGNILNQILSSGEIKIDKFNFTQQRSHHIESINTIVSSWRIDGHKNKATVQYKANIVYDDGTSSHKMRFYTNFYHWLKDGAIDLENLSVNAGANLPNIPTDFFEIITGMKDLNKMFGDTINVNMKLDFDPKSAETSLIDFQCSSDLFKCKAKLSIGDTITLIDSRDTPLVEWTMNQKTFDMLRSLIVAKEMKDIAIQENALLKISVSDLSIPWKKAGQRSFRSLLANLAAKADFSIQHLNLKNKKNGQGARYATLEGKVNTIAFSELVSFSLKGVGDLLPKIEPFSLSLNGQFDHLLKDNDALNLANLAFKVEASLNKAPLALLCEFFYPYHLLHQQIDSLLGNRIDGSIRMRLDRLQGSIDVDISGGQGQLSFAGMINEGVLSLYKPLQAEVKVTPKLGSSVLSYFNPLLSTAQSSSQPLKINIDNGGFSLPLYPWKTKEFQAPNISIEIGKLKFKNNGTLGQVLSVLNYAPRQDEEINIWIMPIKALISEGKINLTRLDMLIADRFPIALWGSANLPDNKLKMVIGLTPIALNNAFKVKGLPKGSLFQIPLRGTLDNPTMNTTQAAAQMASLVAQAQGPQGVLIGSVIDLLAGRGDKKVPPPTTQLPWNTDLPEEKPAANVQKTEKIIEDAAEKVLKKLFK